MLWLYSYFQEGNKVDLGNSPSSATTIWRKKLPSKLMLVTMDLEQFFFKAADLWHLPAAEWRKYKYSEKNHRRQWSSVWRKINGEVQTYVDISIISDKTIGMQEIDNYCLCALHEMKALSEKSMRQAVPTGSVWDDVMLLPLEWGPSKACFNCSNLLHFSKKWCSEIRCQKYRDLR